MRRESVPFVAHMCCGVKSESSSYAGKGNGVAVFPRLESHYSSNERQLFIFFRTGSVQIWLKVNEYSYNVATLLLTGQHAREMPNSDAVAQRKKRPR